MRWQDIHDEKEKYAAYLCSREWCEKREAVRARAKDKCERCHVLPMNACHHLTYKRKYNEQLEDLQAICTQCHEFTHGKSVFDPSECRQWLRYLLLCRDEGRVPVPDDLMCFWHIMPGFFGTDQRLLGKLFAIELLYRKIAELRYLDGLTPPPSGSPHHTSMYVAEELERLAKTSDAELPFSFFNWVAVGFPTVNSEGGYEHTRNICGV